MDYGADYDFLIKVIVAGNSGVGKSSLLQQYVDKTFTDQFIATIGVDFKIKSTMLKSGKKAKLQLWDTAGQERFRSIVASYWRGADGVLLVFDVTERASFDAVKTWAEDIDRYARPAVQKILIGNKSDMERKRVVSYEEANNLARRLGIVYFETSAKSSNGVQDAFEAISNQVAENYQSIHGMKQVEKKNLETRQTKPVEEDSAWKWVCNIL